MNLYVYKVIHIIVPTWKIIHDKFIMDTFLSFFQEKGITKNWNGSLSKAVEYIFFSRVHGTFSRINHRLGHKRILNIFKKAEIKSSIFSDHNSKETRNQLQGGKKKNPQTCGG